MKQGAKLVLKDIDGSSPWVVMNRMHDLLISGNISHEPIPDELEVYLHSLGMETVSKFNKQVYVYPHTFLTTQKAIN